MRLTPKLVAAGVTLMLVLGTLSNAALCVGLIWHDGGLILAGIVGNVASVGLSMLLLLICGIEDKVE